MSANVHPRIAAARARALLLWSLTALLAGCSSERRTKSAVKLAAVAPFREVPIGLCEDHPPESTSEARLREDFQLLANAGVRVLRVSFGWDDLEPARDEYDFRPVDQLLRVASEFGVRLIPYVCYTPPWLAPPDTKPSDIYRTPPTELAEFEQLMELLSSKYRGRFQSWELWNEPDNQEYWLGTPAEYASLLAAGARGVKRGDPDARVVLGGIAGHLDFLEQLLSQHGAADAIDVINLHSYSETWNPEPLEAITTYLERAAELARSYGQAEPLWLAEVGYSTFRRGNFVSNWTSARFDFEHTPPFQAAVLLRVLAMARAVPEVELIAWYELRDLPAGTEVIGDQNNRHLGVLAPSGEPKPAFEALKRALPMLSAPLRPLRVRVDAQGVEARAFQGADGRCTIVAWQPTQELPETLPRARARFTLEASTSRPRAHTSDALGELSAELALESTTPIRTAALELTPERTHLVVVEGCQ